MSQPADPAATLEATTISMDEDAPASLGFSKAQEPESWLLQLPDPALPLVLQQLDPCGLACTAVTCRTLSQAVPAVTASATLQSRTKDDFKRKAGSFALWLAKHSERLDSLTQCSVQGCPNAAQDIRSLSCLKLEQLHLERVDVQLEATPDCSGVLGGLPLCTQKVRLPLWFAYIHAMHHSKQGSPSANTGVALLASELQMKHECPVSTANNR
jgi:hypothetical protein